MAAFPKTKQLEEALGRMEQVMQTTLPLGQSSSLCFSEGGGREASLLTGCREVGFFLGSIPHTTHDICSNSHPDRA